MTKCNSPLEKIKVITASADKIVKGNEKSIPMHITDLIDFITIANASFAVFKIIINGSMGYFFMYLNIK